MTTPETIELKIDSLAYGGEGVARVEGKVYFVEGALPGERVRAQIIEEKKSFARAETVEILEPSKHRVEAPCKYFGRCGGCQLQHLAYEEQLVWKHKSLEELLARIGNVKDIAVDPVIPSPKPFGYRNRVGLTLMHAAKGKIRQGFLARDSHELVDIDSCHIAMPTINQAINELARKNEMKNVFGDFFGRLKLELVTDGQNTFFLPWQSFDEKTGARTKPDEGKILREKIGGIEFEFSPHVFFQVNSYLLPQLIASIGTLLAESKDACLFDLYSGVGLVGVSLSDRVKKVVGLEENKLAHQFAIRNIKRNKIENVYVYTGRVESQFKKVFLKQKAEKNILLLDPPRGGIEASLVENFKEFQPEIDSIIYLSCEPSILARDLARLKQAGFVPERVMPFDLFPQTQIFETVVILKSKA
ncbi:MAG: class I SAM-dependent RNA methyltransferase [Candidatus Omnitrophica bacterium]|nr:class I SAM-dependent RNA methyltransferase [Candidatus Omnitrophota bacterium]